LICPGRLSRGLSRKAIEINPKDAYYRTVLGNVLETLGRYAEAEAAYRRAVEIDPGYPAHGRGWALCSPTT